MSVRFVLLLISLVFAGSVFAQDDDLGNLSANPYDPNSTSNPYGAGNPYNANSINNPYGKYGSEYSNNSVNNPYATDTPKLYDSEGNYRGKLSSNPYDPDSISNPYGTYGNPYSSDSINNPYGAGNPYSADSPTNPYGTGWKIVGQDQDDTLDSYSSDDDDYGSDNVWKVPTYDYSTPDYSAPDYGTQDLYKPYTYGDDTTDIWDTSSDDSDYNWDN